jgi:hypothetical protein
MTCPFNTDLLSLISTLNYMLHGKRGKMLFE